MSVIRVGSNGSYAEGWDGIFGKTKAGKAKAVVAVMPSGTAPSALSRATAGASARGRQPS